MTGPNATQALAALRDAVSMWRIAPYMWSQEVIDAATECLVVGLDSPALRELAGASPSESHWVLEPLIVATAEELEMARLFDIDLQIGALSAMLRRLEAGRVAPRELVSWVHTHIGYDGGPAFQPFLDVDYLYEEAEYVGYDEAVLDEWTRQEAAAFLAGDPSPGPPPELFPCRRDQDQGTMRRMFLSIRARLARRA